MSMFWSQAASEPKRQHRFLLDLPNLGVQGGAGYTQYLAKTVTTPSYTLGVTEHKFLGNTFHYPGAVTWDEVTAQIVNSVAPNGDEILYQALYSAGYYDPEDQESYFLVGGVGEGGDRNMPGTPNKVNSLAALGQVKIIELNGQGDKIDQWTLNNAFITNVKFGDLDYSGEDLLNIDITFRYDWATFQVLPDGRLAIAGTGADGIAGTADDVYPRAPRPASRGLR